MSDTPAYSTFVEAAREKPPQVGLVLGSGMGPVAQRLRREQSIAFADIPGMTATSVVGHSGRVSLGEWAGRRLLLFEGRLHFYEGHSWDQVTLPVRTAAQLGVRVMLLTNAAGGIADDLVPGSLMALRDHIEWTKLYCWREPGPARPSPYSPRLLKMLAQAAQETGIPLHHGVYAMLTGPCYETPAEIRALKTWGADAVGMSTAREVQAGYDLGLECAALSLITNRAAGLSAAPLDHKEVLTTAAQQSERLAELLERFLRLPLAA